MTAAHYSPMSLPPNRPAIMNKMAAIPVRMDRYLTILAI